MTSRPVPSPSAASVLLPALLTGGLLWACYFPLAWGWLAWVALVPLLFLVRSQARPWKIYWSAYLGGLLFFFPAISWMRVADERMYYTWAMLATYCALYFPAAIFLMRRLDCATRLPLLLTVPAVWVALEFVRSFLLTGFAWYYLGHTQHSFLPIIQIADLGGAYTVSFLVALVNAWLFEILVSCHMSWKSVRTAQSCVLHGFRKDPPQGSPTSRPDAPWAGLSRRTVLGAATVLVALVGTLCYGFTRLEQELFRPGPRLTLLQGNLDQRLRNEAFVNKDAARTTARHYGDLCQLAFAQAPDLIVWPETSVPGEWFDFDRGRPINEVPLEWIKKARWSEDLVAILTRGCPTHHLLGLNANFLGDDNQTIRYNSALLVQPDSRAVSRYDKIHRVPFGEYVPLVDWLPFMNEFAPYDFPYSIRRGEHLTRFALKKYAGPGQPEETYHFGVLICYEDTDPFLARRYGVRDEDGPPADFLINISNDGWFDGSSEHDEHLAICRFRAIECRRAVARSVNMGISAVIDSNGRVLAPELFTLPEELKDEWKRWAILERHGRAADLPVSQWGDYKKVAGVLTAIIPIDQRLSLYSLWGDWLPGVCWMVVLAGLIWAFRARWRMSRTVPGVRETGTK
jgi:apolipoprotein N-acyltransferase